MPKKFSISIALLLLVGISSIAQNQPYIDDRPYHFGFSLGINTMDFTVQHNPNIVDGARSSILTPGFSVGLIGNLRLNRYFSLRCTPTFHFSDRTLNYRLLSTDTIIHTAQTSVISMPITLPVYIKYAAERQGNYRPYILAGGGIYYDVARDRSKDILLQPIDYFLEFGIGVDFYFTFFKLSPELKFAIGFNDMLTPLSQRPEVTDPNKQLYTNALNRLGSRMLTLTFNFE